MIHSHMLLLIWEPVFLFPSLKNQILLHPQIAPTDFVATFRSPDSDQSFDHREQTALLLS